MKRDHLQLLVCPDCRRPFRLVGPTENHSDDIDAGLLSCDSCPSQFPIVRGVPRFVANDDYTDAFGFQWRRHATTQHDLFSHTRISEDRFFDETQWPRQMRGQTVLEIGCGAGRFTSVAAATGATVVAVDMSTAVDVNSQLQSSQSNVLVIQADLYNLPLQHQSFDGLFCLGVLQHTPRVQQAFETLPAYLKAGGKLVIDVYDRREGLLRLVEPFYRNYYWLRPLTRRMPDRSLYRCVQRYVHALWPLTRQIARVPVVGRYLNRMLLIHDYRNRYPLTEEQLKEWAVLDAFDNLSPRYDQRQTLTTVKRWFDEAAMADVDVQYGYNGIQGRGTKC